MIDTNKYDAVRPVGNDFYAVREGYKWGLVDSCNNVLMRTVYDYISCDDGVLWANYKGKEFDVPLDRFPLAYDFMYDFEENGLAKVVKDEKYGVIDKGYCEIIPCKYDSLHINLNCKKIFVSLKNGEKKKEGVYSFDGIVLLDCIYEYISYPIIEKETDGAIKYGLIDDEYNIVVPCENKSQNDIYFPAHNNECFKYYYITQEGGYSFLWIEGVGFVDVGYENIERTFSSYLFCSRKKNYPTYNDKANMNARNSILNSNTYSIYSSDTYTDVYYEKDLLFSYNAEEIAIVRPINGKKGCDEIFIYRDLVIDKHGLICRDGIKTPAIYDKIEPHCDYNNKFIVGIRNALYQEEKGCSSHKAVIQDGIVDIFDQNGYLIRQSVRWADLDINKCKCCLDYIRLSINNSAAVFKESKLIIHENEYEEVGSFIKQEMYKAFDVGYAIVKQDGLTGVVNSNGRLVIPLIYNKIEEFNPVWRNDSYSNDFLFAQNQNGVAFFVANKNLRKLNYAFILKEPTPDGLFIVSKSKIPTKYTKFGELYSYEKYMRDDDMVDLSIVHNKKDKQTGETLAEEKKPTPQPSEQKFRKFEIRKLEGPKILDKIELPEERKRSKQQAVVGTRNPKLPSTHNHLFGIIDSLGNEVIPCEYTIDEIKKRNVKQSSQPRTKTYFVLLKYEDLQLLRDGDTQKVGIMDKAGVVVCDFIYESISRFNEKGTAIVSMGIGKEGIIDKAGRVLLPCDYIIHNQSCGEVDKRKEMLFYIVEKDGKYGMVDAYGNSVLKCIYPKLDFREGLLQYGLVEAVDNEKKGVVNIKTPKTYLLECVYKSIEIKNKYSKTQDDYLLARCHNRCVAINLATKELLLDLCEADIVDLPAIRTNYAVVKFDHERAVFYRIYSMQMKCFVDGLVYEEINVEGERHIQVFKNNKWGLFNLDTGIEDVPCEYYEEDRKAWGTNYAPGSFMFSSNRPLAVVRKNKKDGLYGYINEKNQLAIDFTYSFAEPFSEGFAIVKMGGTVGSHYMTKPNSFRIESDGTWAILNSKGEVIVDGFEDLLGFHEGLTAARKNGKWGFVDGNGRTIIPFRFAKAKSFSDGLAAVAFKTRYGYIDKHNKTVIPFQYTAAHAFCEGTADVETFDCEEVISKDGIRLKSHPKQRRVEDDYDYDYRRDSWDAMTDGQYGDMPDGFGGDFDFMGY